MSYDNNNRFALWVNNERKEATHPHLTGQGECMGDGLYASAWFSKDISDEDRKLLAGILKRYSSKKPFVSISLKPKQESRKESKQADNDFYDDQIPF